VHRRWTVHGERSEGGFHALVFAQLHFSLSLSLSLPQARGWLCVCVPSSAVMLLSF